MTLTLTDSLQWLVGFVLNTLLILILRRLPILTTSGWIHSGILGTVLWGCLGWKGWLSVVFYLILGSLVTKLGFSYKQKEGIEESRGGRRGPENVWGSAFTGTALAILIQFDIVSKQLLLVGFAASFAAKLADTFGSEIGKRYGRTAFLITTLKSVPPGSDGAISLQGTLASLLGSFLMTTFMYSLDFVQNKISFIIVFTSGIIATLIESYIGAIAQFRYNWMTNEIVNALQTTLSALIAISMYLYFI